MAEVLPGRSLLSPFGGHDSLMLSSQRRNPSLVAFRRGASRKIDPLRPSSSSSSSSSKSSSFHGRELVTGAPRGRPVMGYLPLIPVQDLHDSLLNAGDKLVIVDFFSPGCGVCRVLYPKICQFAVMNRGVLFLRINHEKHKSMCHSLNVHVLPFSRFYRGAHCRLCSFSCTNATIHKFKDALANRSF